MSLGAIVDAHAGRPAVEPDEVVEDPDHAGARNRRPDLDRQGLPIALVEHVEGPGDLLHDSGPVNVTESARKLRPVAQARTNFGERLIK